MYDDINDQCIAIKGAQRMWGQALVCLLDGLSHKKTAAKIGVSEETLTRWWDKGVKGRPQLSAVVEDIEEARKAMKDAEDEVRRLLSHGISPSKVAEVLKMDPGKVGVVARDFINDMKAKQAVR